MIDVGLVSQGLFYLTVYNPSRREIRERTQGRDWNRGHGGRPLTGLLSMAQSWLSSTPRITCSGMAPPVVGWTLTHRSLIKKMPYMLLYRLSWWRYFLSWDSLFPAYLSLCQVNKNQPTQEAETSTLFFIRFCYRFKNQNESYHTTSPNDLFHGTIFPLLSKLGEVCSPPLLPSPSMNIKIITLSFPQNQVGLFIAISFSLF